MAALSSATLDRILGLQLVVAWAGEGRCVPRRLGWWRTDVVDPDGGGDFFERLLPRTHAWASLQAAREAAVRTDAAARSGTVDPGAILSLYHLGAHIDEPLERRLATHKRTGTAHSSVIGPGVDMAAPFDADALGHHLTSGMLDVPSRVTPAGRELRGAAPDDPAHMAAVLAAALVPFADAYPLPHFRLHR